MAVWDGFEYDRVRGPYKKKRPGGRAPHWQVNLYREGDQKPKTISRTSKEIIDNLAADLRAQLSGKQKARAKKRGPRRKGEGVKVPRAKPGKDGQIDYDAELQGLAAALRDATQADQVDVIKRKADTLKSLRLLEASLPKKEDDDPTEKMSIADLLEAAAEHLRMHGYTVTHANAERAEAGQEEDQQVVRGGGEGQEK